MNKEVQVTIGDVRGLLLDADKRPVLRLLPQMDEVCRGYAIAHLGDIENIAGQVWILNATDWMRQQTFISLSFMRNSDYHDLQMYIIIENLAIKIAKDSMSISPKIVDSYFWHVFNLKIRYISKEASIEELEEARKILRYDKINTQGTNRGSYHLLWIVYWATSPFISNNTMYRILLEVVGFHMPADTDYPAARDVQISTFRHNFLNLWMDMIEQSEGI